MGQMPQVGHAIARWIGKGEIGSLILGWNACIGYAELTHVELIDREIVDRIEPWREAAIPAFAAWSSHR